MSIYNNLLKDIVEDNKEYQISVSLKRCNSDGIHDYIKCIYNTKKNVHVCTVISMIESLRIHGKADILNFTITNVMKNGCTKHYTYNNVGLSDFITFNELKKFIFESKLLGITQGGFFTETEEHRKNADNSLHYKRNRIAGSLQSIEIYKEECYNE